MDIPIARSYEWLEAELARVTAERDALADPVTDDDIVVAWDDFHSTDEMRPVLERFLDRRLPK